MAQQPNALPTTKLQLGSFSKEVNLYVPLQFIIGDVEGGDQLCSRWYSRLGNCSRLCRTCDVSTEDAANTNINCNRIELADVQKLHATNDLDGLKSICQRPYYNALFDIDCGGDPYGVFSMIHTEGLHAIEQGLIPYMLEILFVAMPKSEQRTLDHLIKNLLSYPRQHGYKKFPRLLWHDGVTTLSYLTADLKVGKMFAICCIASTLEGESFFSNVLEDGATTWRKMLYVFQQILCYWAWLKQDTFWISDDLEACHTATDSIKTMMKQLQALWPRKVGLEWNLTKLHEQFHVPMDIHRHGRHKNVHTGPPEHHHVTLKHAAKKTQLNKQSLDFQTGERLIERLTIQFAYDRVSHHISNIPKNPTYPGECKNASKGIFKFTTIPTQGRFAADGHVIWKKTEYTGLVPLMHDAILALLGSKLLLKYGLVHTDPNDVITTTLDIPFFTEYQRNGIVYRAHPRYRGGHAYYDWVYIKWWDGEDVHTHETKYVSIIGRILCFFQHPNGELMAVVHSCKWDTNEQHGVFGTYWHLEYDGPIVANRPHLEMISVDAIENHVCMIPYSSKNPFMWVHIWDPSEWPACFQTIQPPETANLNTYVQFQ